MTKGTITFIIQDTGRLLLLPIFYLLTYLIIETLLLLNSTPRVSIISILPTILSAPNLFTALTIFFVIYFFVSLIVLKLINKFNVLEKNYFLVVWGICAGIVSIPIINISGDSFIYQLFYFLF